VTAADEDQWNPACWDWAVPDLSHLRSIDDPTAREEAAENALRAWHAGRCGMCGFLRTLFTDHDHQSGLVRRLLCRSCNNLEGRQLSADEPLGRYRARCPAHLLSVGIRYFNQFTGQYAEPINEDDLRQRFLRAADAIRSLHIGDPDPVEDWDRCNGAGSSTPPPPAP
jgi:hypothetical protein